jgi:hypothetical protein
MLPFRSGKKGTPRSESEVNSEQRGIEWSRSFAGVGWLAAATTGTGDPRKLAWIQRRSSSRRARRWLSFLVLLVNRHGRGTLKSPCCNNRPRSVGTAIGRAHTRTREILTKHQRFKLLIWSQARVLFSRVSWPAIYASFGFYEHWTTV